MEPSTTTSSTDKYVHEKFVVRSESDVIPDWTRYVYIHICDMEGDGSTDFVGNVLNIKFPPNVHTVEIGECFGEDICKMKFPKNMRVLITGDYWSPDIGGLVIQEGVHTVIFGDKFDSDLSGVTFSSTVHTIGVGGNFSVARFGHANLPKNIHTIDISQCYYTDFDTAEFPSHLETVIMRRSQVGRYHLPEGCIESIPEWDRDLNPGDDDVEWVESRHGGHVECDEDDDSSD